MPKTSAARKGEAQRTCMEADRQRSRARAIPRPVAFLLCTSQGPALTSSPFPAHSAARRWAPTHEFGCSSRGAMQN